MSSHSISPRRVLAAGLGACAVLLGGSGFAQAEPPSPAPPAPAPPAPAPPNCTAADLAGVMSGVTASTSVYLFTHPAVNDFFTSLKDKTGEEKRAALQSYTDANPQVKAELEGIRQPAKDFRARCG